MSESWMYLYVSIVSCIRSQKKMFGKTEFYVRSLRFWIIKKIYSRNNKNKWTTLLINRKYCGIIESEVKSFVSIALVFVASTLISTQGRASYLSSDKAVCKTSSDVSDQLPELMSATLFTSIIPARPSHTSGWEDFFIEAEDELPTHRRSADQADQLSFPIEQHLGVNPLIVSPQSRITVTQEISPVTRYLALRVFRLWFPAAKTLTDSGASPNCTMKLVF